jgi:hypothetical protein
MIEGAGGINIANKITGFMNFINRDCFVSFVPDLPATGEQRHPRQPFFRLWFRDAAVIFFIDLSLFIDGLKCCLNFHTSVTRIIDRGIDQYHDRAI